MRRSDRHEFGHKKYYDRLGYIYVYTGEEEYSTEDPKMMRSRHRQEFLDEALAALTAGKNIVICPEGTSVSTEASPMPFKAGAFQLAAYVQPEPLIVPIAVANFDKKITRTRLSAVVFDPFALSDHVADMKDRETLFDFVNAFHGRFKGYVKEAVAQAS